MIVWIDRITAVLGIAWFFALLYLPHWFEKDVVFLGTLGLITAMFLLTFFFYGVSGRLLLFTCIAQLMLFGLLHYKLYEMVGATLYVGPDAPKVYHWLLFLAAHVLRAIDFLDILDAYGIHLQSMRHTQEFSEFKMILPGVFLVYMHLVADCLLISYLVRRLTTRKEQEGETKEPSQETKSSGWFSTIIMYAFWLSVAGIITIAAVQGWKSNDWYRWPIFQVLKLADIGDVIQIYQLRWHTVEEGYLVVTLGVVFRFLVAIYLAAGLLRFAKGLATFLAIGLVGLLIGIWYYHRADVRQMMNEPPQDLKSIPIRVPGAN